MKKFILIIIFSLIISKGFITLGLEPVTRSDISRGTMASWQDANISSPPGTKGVTVKDINADYDRHPLKEKHPQAVELLDRRVANGKVYALGNNQYRGFFTMSPLHYKDEQGKFQDIDLRKQNSDNPSFDYKIDKTPYKLYISNNGKRRFYPDRNKPEFIEVLAPAFLNNKEGTWVLENQLQWTDPNFDTELIAENDRVKLLITVKRPISFNSISFNMIEKGVRLLDVLGNITYFDSTEPLPIERVLGLNYQDGVLTLFWDFTGMTYPVTIDPTFNVGASANDAFRWAATTYNLTSVAFDCGNIGGGPGPHEYARFTNINILPGSTINSSYITIACRASSSTTNVNTLLALEAVDNAGTVPTYTAFDTRSSGTGITSTIGWTNISSWTVGTDYTSPDMSLAVQEVVDRAGWASGNAMNVFWKDNGSTSGAQRIGASWDNTSYTEPRFTIEWVEPPANMRFQDVKMEGIRIK